MMNRREALLVEPGWLHSHLQDPDLRILDCTTYLCGAILARALPQDGKLA